MTLRDLKVGQSARIKAVGGEGELRQHFLDMGVIPGAELTLVKLAPMGDPMEFQIHGYELTLRLADAEQIDAEQIESKGTAIRFRKEQDLHLPWLETRTVERRHCSISSPDQISI